MQEFIGGKWDEARPLNGSQAEVEALWDRLIATRATSKKSKKQKPGTVQLAVAANEKPAAGSEAIKIERKSSSEDSPTNSTERKLQPVAVVEKAGIKRGVQDFSVREESQVKKLKAKDLAPAHADKKLWASLFTSTHGKPAVETYSCRSTSGRGWM